MEIDIEKRVEKAKEYHQSGYNCAQSVFLAYSDVLGIDDVVASKLSLPFGGGMGGMHEICGCVSGMMMCTGFVKDIKRNNYPYVRDVAAEYKAEVGSIICKELLGLVPANPPLVKRPCVEYVGIAARIIGERLKHDLL